MGFISKIDVVIVRFILKNRGFIFKSRMAKGYYGNFHLGFTPSISRKSQKRINQTLFKLKLHRIVHLPSPIWQVLLADKIQGWIYLGNVKNYGKNILN